MSKNPVDKLSGLAVITGGTSGIGLELVKLAAKDGCDIIIAANRSLETGEQAARDHGAASVETVDADLATESGVDKLMAAVGSRQVDVLMANAGNGEGGKFFDQSWDDIKFTLDTNVTGTLSLIHQIGKRMRQRNAGRILVTGSIVADIPGTYNLIYNSTKAFIVDFCVGLAEELEESDVVISCLLPGLTDTNFFEHADMENTAVGRSNMKADPAKVAQDGYDALVEGEVKEVSGILNKVQYFFADILPDGLLAKMHEQMAKPRRRENA